MHRADLNTATPPPPSLPTQGISRRSVTNRVNQLGQASVEGAEPSVGSALQNLKKPSQNITLLTLIGCLESGYSSRAELLVDEQLLLLKSLYEDARVQLAFGKAQRQKSRAEIKDLFWGVHNYVLLAFYYPLCRARFYGKFYWEFAGTEPTAFMQAFKDPHFIKEMSITYMRKAIDNIKELNTLKIPLRDLQARCTALEEIFNKETDLITSSSEESFVLINHWTILQRRCQAHLFTLKNFENFPFNQKEKWGMLIKQEVERCWQIWMTEAEEWQKILNSGKQEEWVLNDFINFLRSFEIATVQSGDRLHHLCTEIEKAQKGLPETSLLCSRS